MVALRVSSVDDVATTARLALSADPRISIRNIDVDIDIDDRVTIAGEVTSYAAKLIAADAVRRLPGVHTVENRINGMPWAEPMEIVPTRQHIGRCSASCALPCSYRSVGYSQSAILRMARNLCNCIL